MCVKACLSNRESTQTHRDGKYVCIHRFHPVSRTRSAFPLSGLRAAPLTLTQPTHGVRLLVLCKQPDS